MIGKPKEKAYRRISDYLIIIYKKRLALEDITPKERKQLEHFKEYLRKNNRSRRIGIN